MGHQRGSSHPESGSYTLRPLLWVHLEMGGLQGITVSMLRYQPKERKSWRDDSVLKKLTIFAEDPGSVPRTQVRHLTSVCTPVPGGPMPSGLHRHLLIYSIHKPTLAHTQKHK